MINASRSHDQSASTGASGDLNPELILNGIAEFASDRKALEMVALDLRGMVGYADYLFICTGRSDRQVKAIHDSIHLGLKDRHRLLPRRVEGLTEGRWVLLDYLDVVVHVFTAETREHYRLEQLWGEAPSVALPEFAVAPEG